MKSYKKKVLFVGSFKNQSKSGHTGGQMFACNTLINSKISEKVDWVLLDTTAPSNLGEFFLKRGGRFIGRLFSFIKILTFNKINVILIFTSSGFSFLEKGIYVLVGNFLGKKTIFAPRSGYLLEDLKKPNRKKYIAFVLKRSTYVICQSENWKNIFNEICPHPYKYRVIKNWIDESSYQEVNKEKSFIPKSDFHFLFLGWIDNNKGVFEILEVAKYFNNQKEINFTLAGNGKDFKKLTKLIEEYGLNNIHLPGWVDRKKKIELLNNFSFFILPSFREGSPNSLKEAMLCGLIPISTRVGAIPEIIENGKNGFLVQPGRSDLLIKTINELITLKPEQLRQISTRARKTIINNHSIPNAIHEFQQIIL